MTILVLLWVRKAVGPGVYLVAYGVGLLTAYVEFSRDSSVLAFGSAAGVAQLWDVIYLIIVGPVFTSVMIRTGAMKGLNDYLATFAADKVEQLLLTSVGILPIIWAVMGPVSYAFMVPLLVSSGLTAVDACSVFLSASCWPVAFATLGLPVMALATSTGYAANILASTSWFVFFPAVYLGACFSVAYGRSVRDVRKYLFLIVASSSAAAAAGWYTSSFSYELSGMAAGIGSTAVIVLWVLVKREGFNSRQRIQKGFVIKSIMPLLVIVGCVVLSKTFPVASILEGFQLKHVFLPGITTPVRLGIFTGGSYVLLASLTAAAMHKLSWRETLEAMVAGVRKAISPLICLVAVAAMGGLMNSSGMITAIGEQAAKTGGVYPFVTPLLGALGHFATGSAAVSNVLFGPLHVQVARLAGMSGVWLAVQNLLGAAFVTAIVPSKLVLSLALVGTPKEQREVFRRGIVTTVIFLGLLYLLESIFFL